MGKSGITRLVLPIVLSLGCSIVWAQGYSTEGNRVVVRTKDHWSNWTFPKDVVLITESGTVRPRFIRKNINACLDAKNFVYSEGGRGGIRAAGSNFEDTSNLIDGDPNTFWEPDRDDPIRDWWVQIDLGRLVSTTKIVLRFVKEGDGDPFLQFKVLVSDGEPAFAGSKLLNFRLVGKTRKPNKDQRVFEYELSPTLKADENWEGSVLQYVQVVVTDSDFDKAESISREEYEVLDLDRRGVVEYFRRSVLGTLRLVTKGEYESLDPDSRGPIRYYRREVPRLAEVEVWSVGDNISLGILDRGGSINATARITSLPVAAFDGDYTSHWLASQYLPARQVGVLTVDLGAVFWVDIIRLVTGPVPVWRNPMLGYITKVSDGSKAPDGSLVWEVVSPKERERNTAVVFRFEDKFEPLRLRFLDFRNVDIAGEYSGMGRYYEGVGVHEFQIYGEGYVPEVTLVSDLIEMGGEKNLTSIEWVAETPPGTKIEIRTRTGDRLGEVKHFFTSGGKEITERAWNDLPGFLRGPVTTEFIPGSGWSGWSQTYLKPGDPITSPSPRKYLMIQVKLLSDDPNLAPSLNSITVNFLPPVTSQVIGEISPDRGVSAAKPQDFVLFIKPTLLPTNPGFDEISIEAPPGVEMELLGISLGREEDFLNLSTEDFLPYEEELFLNASDDTLKVIQDRGDRLWARLPEPIGIGGLIQVKFRSTLFLNGTLFRASVSNSTIPNSWQRVDPGDATFLTSSQTMSVSIPIGGGIIGDVEVGPNPFTPNGDGINDRLEVRFTVFKVNTGKPVRIVIYTLRGEVVKELSESRLSASGRYSILWSGEDGFGRTVPPGIYLCQIWVDVDSQSAEDSRVVRPVYCAY